MRYIKQNILVLKIKLFFPLFLNCSNPWRSRIGDIVNVLFTVHLYLCQSEIMMIILRF